MCLIYMSRRTRETFKLITGVWAHSCHSCSVERFPLPIVAFGSLAGTEYRRMVFFGEFHVF